MKPTALIADDEAHLAQYLHDRLNELWPELDIVGIARNGPEALKLIDDEGPQIAFLDIRMPGLTGLEVARGIEGRSRVVFVTAYDECAVQAFEQEALDYVLKPVKRDRLQRTIERVRRAIESGAASGEDSPQLLAALRKLLPTAAPSTERLRWVRASVGELMHQIDIEDVLFFRADDKYTCVHTTGGAEHLIRTPIQELAQALDPNVFVQVHRSTIVNLEHLAGTRRDEASRLFLRLRGHAAELPVSRAYVHLFRAM